ncbi:3-oxoacyl-[acyl-carrier-protein] reductase [Wickerhamomyces ciferrii]|uniref:3-oxoacyl-[acyl-carrier-protein] reductase n=1 Tax=Wickerhamomyces ciferrii (strain ATCC 14091 / BCRC 22168 / CBS 111 / JCM 3599 / NBRC 0793 / NRRL Y-1031 F-60-10) TaxID=1206466 RepID=K0KBY2_WICCF|nr:3-oxoacyl-[acyl-carrier-protein] reductase [Wickerhamomyces ciferrii]CCH42575.1 3-oxoacyl-[acyl-carrier-protein] reductase [Wickerhamomyces ciferrii]
MTKNYVITGANRGIGLALVKELAKDSNNRVFATARDPSNAKDLSDFAKEHSNVEVIQLKDTTSVEATDEAVAAVEAKLGKDEGIDVLIPNAGVSYSFETTLNTSPEVYKDTYNINVIGNLITFQKFYKLLLKSNNREVFFTSSVGGSITGFIPHPISPYASTKSVINYLVRAFNVDLKNEGFKVVAFHPGLVGTDLGNVAIEKAVNGDFELAKKLYGLITPEESAHGIVENIIKGLSQGKIDVDHLWSYDGTQLQW